MNLKKLEAYIALADEARSLRNLPREIAALEQALDVGNSRSIPLLLRLAKAEGEFDLVDESAARLTVILRLDPNHKDAARQLSLTLSTARLEAPEKLDPFGLQAALRHTGVDYDSIGRAATAYLTASTPFGQVVRSAKTSPEAAAAKALANPKTYLTHPLLHQMLRQTVNRSYDVERLLTAIRRHILLHVSAEELGQNDIFAFALGLIAQCWNNEHIFAETGEERDALLECLSALDDSPRKSLNDNPNILRNLVIFLLYRPFREVEAKVLGQAPLHLRPKAFAQLIENRRAVEARLRTIAHTIPTEVADTGDAITQRVSRHYEQNPYPRWIAFHHPATGGARTDLSAFFTAEELAFLEGPHRVLVAGAGTGRHALGSAMRYHPLGDVLAIDLSRASLAYAAIKAEELQIDTIRFLQADLHGLGEEHGNFDIIEAVGVLHHTADVFAAWRALLDRLKPGGLMWIGLYSAVARANIQALRKDASFPGSSASDEAARIYRKALIDDEQTRDAKKLTASDDFYALSDFRDLVLNAHEAQLTLPEIQTFLNENGLEFRGFTASPTLWKAFKAGFPEAQWPGLLDQWWAFENENPTAFDAMYQFWCIKTT